MDLTERVSKMSYAKRLNVGSIIVKDNTILSYGWNGMPSGWDNECEYVVPEKEIVDVESRTIEYHPEHLKTKPEVLHAEMNALMKVARSTESSEGATLFCTHSPCIECAKGIYQAGIKEVFYKNDYRSTHGIEFLKKCGVSVNKV
jgi:dCMP deaminase